MRRMRVHHEEEDEEHGEINLVPYMDIVTNIIIFLLASVVSQMPIGNLNVTSPTISSTGGAAVEEERQQPLNLTVTVSQNGFVIAASGGVMPTIEKRNGDYDYKALTAKLMEIKAQPENAQETKAFFNADSHIPYDLVVKTLDAMREDPNGKVLFPDIAFTAGIL
jgi:biopolymer transport protein TolR